MLAATFPIAILLIIVLPIALAWALVRQLGTAPRLVFLGAATFLLAQALRLPALEALSSGFSSGLLPTPDAAYAVAVNIAILALSAGVFEESARYLAYRHVIPNATTWNDAVTFGAGHGGAEAVGVGVLMALEYTRMVALASPDAPAVTPQSAEEATRLVQQAALYWATPWYVPLLALAERLFAIAFHITMAVVVLQAVVRRNIMWLLAAIVAHAALNALAVGVFRGYGPIVAEIVIGLATALALYVLFRMRTLERTAATPAAVAP